MPNTPVPIYRLRRNLPKSYCCRFPIYVSKYIFEIMLIQTMLIIRNPLHLLIDRILPARNFHCDMDRLEKSEQECDLHDDIADKIRKKKMNKICLNNVLILPTICTKTNSSCSVESELSLLISTDEICAINIIITVTLFAMVNITL